MKNIFDGMFTITGVNSLLELLDKFSHQIEELEQTIEYYQKENKRLHQVFDIKDSERVELVKENKELQRIITDLQSDLAGATNDYKQAVNEIKILNKQIDKLIAKNNELRLRHKMFTTTILNAWYGSFCYTDTDSIKETKDNDSNN